MYACLCSLGSQIQEAVVEKDVKQYTYADGEDYIFMDMVSHACPEARDEGEGGTDVNSSQLQCWCMCRLRSPD